MVMFGHMTSCLTLPNHLSRPTIDTHLRNNCRYIVKHLELSQFTGEFTGGFLEFTGEFTGSFPEFTESTGGFVKNGNNTRTAYSDHIRLCNDY